MDWVCIYRLSTLVNYNNYLDIQLLVVQLADGSSVRVDR